LCMDNLSIALAAGVLIFCAASTRGSAKEDSPLVEVRLNGDAYPAPNLKPSSGVIFIACTNGHVARAESEQLAGKELKEGELAVQSAERLRQFLTSSNLRALEVECEKRVVDAGTAGITVWGGSTRKFLRCTWPPLEQHGKVLEQLIRDAEIVNAVSRSGRVGFQELCQ